MAFCSISKSRGEEKSWDLLTDCALKEITAFLGRDQGHATKRASEAKLPSLEVQDEGSAGLCGLAVIQKVIKASSSGGSHRLSQH